MQPHFFSFESSELQKKRNQTPRLTVPRSRNEALALDTSAHHTCENVAIERLCRLSSSYLGRNSGRALTNKLNRLLRDRLGGSSPKPDCRESACLAGADSDTGDR